MKQNSRDYPEFYNWLIQPFIKKPHRIQLLRRLNRLLTFVMPGVYGLAFCKASFFGENVAFCLDSCNRICLV